MLSIWASGNDEELLVLAHHIESTGNAKSYLSVPEHALFTSVLDKNLETWKAFINGKIPCQIRVTEIPSEGQTPSTTLQPIDSITLAFRVRFMLWDYSIGPLNGLSGPSIRQEKLLKDNKREEDEYDDFDDEEPQSAELPEVLEVEITEENAETDIRTLKTTFANYYRMYHSFETDWEILSKYKKLKESDRQVDVETVDRPFEKMISSVQFGAANLSLKNLLSVIDNKREELNLTDVELRNLISDVRKNRSKWANEDRIGQEELYEACEKVVLDLRGTTEHSTAFLNKVSKRDAPNYYQIIKYPMDLNTVMKKLKALQYNSKKEFVDDLMIIWQNCLTYNSDPKHFLRAHAIAMRKKTLSLIPLIPDITVRNRAEVEAEAQAEAQQEQTNDGPRESQGKGMKGTKRRRTEAIPSTEGEPDSVPTHANGTSNGIANDDIEVKEETSPRPSESGTERSLEELRNEEEKHDEVPSSNEVPSAASTENTGDTAVHADVDMDSLNSTNTTNHPESLVGKDSPSVSVPPEGTPAEEGDGTDSQQAEEDPEASLGDFESIAWRKTFTKKRSDYLYLRHELFRQNRIQPEAPVLLRKPVPMARTLEIQNSAIRQPENARIYDEDPILVDYDVMCGMPPDRDSEKTEPLPSMQDLPASKFGTGGKLNKLYVRNLNEIQKLRRLSTRLNIIKDMQQNPQGYMPAGDGIRFPEIAEPDPHVSTRMPNAAVMHRPSIRATFRKSVAKVAMHNGFEACQLSALDTLTDIAGDFMQKLGHLLVSSLEDPDLENASAEKIVSGCLQNMGIPKLDTLARYISNDVCKYNRKLAELKKAISAMLRELLRPAGLDKYEAEQFNDNSDQFTLGQFSNDIGDDYFGFKAMGLDKELGLEDINIPFHLLQQKTTAESSHNADGPNASDHVSTLPDYPQVTPESLPNIVGVIRPFFARSFEQSKNVVDNRLIEDDKLSSKQKFTRAKVPVTGKIPIKRKPKSHIFIKPPRPEGTA